jgi:uncharacterized protein
MSADVTAPRPSIVLTSSLLPFMLMTFVLAWGILAIIVVFNDQVTAALGELSGSHPLFMLAVYSPAIAALVLVTLRSGPQGLIGFLSRLLLWRCSAGWYAFLLLGIPAIFVAGSLLGGTLFEKTFPFASMAQVLGAMVFMLILGPVEEIGWRGYALPLLQRKLAPIWAGLVLGVIWGVWHLPAFFLEGTPQSAWGFMPFFLGSVAVSVILTPMFNASRGSILLAALFHFQLINPLWPDAQPYDTYLFVLVAMIVVWIHRATMFGRSDAVTEVVPQRVVAATA